MQNYIYIERAEACLQRVLYICNSIVRSTTPSRQARWHCELTTWWALRFTTKPSGEVALRIDHMVGIAN